MIIQANPVSWSSTLRQIGTLVDFAVRIESGLALNQWAFSSRSYGEMIRYTANLTDTVGNRYR